jgi:ATP-dependent exoDNAse (exonuclease V) alpha subunit
VQKADGSIKQLPLERAQHFQAYSTQDIPLAAGDKIRITQNGFTRDKAHRLNNGAIYDVKGFTKKGDIKLSNGWVIDKQYSNLAHGYCTTSVAAQGKTVDRVFIAQSSESFPASSQEQFYVSASRGRQQARIYTDDLEALREAVARSSVRTSATDLVKQETEREQAERINRLAFQEAVPGSETIDREKDEDQGLEKEL